MAAIHRALADLPVDLEDAIHELKRERNAVILAHYYQEDDLQDLADHVGDSLALAQAAAKVDCDVIAFCGVHFMAETAKILNPDSTVVIPDLEAGCSYACCSPALRTLCSRRCSAWPYTAPSWHAPMSERFDSNCSKSALSWYAIPAACACS